MSNFNEMKAKLANKIKTYKNENKERRGLYKKNVVKKFSKFYDSMDGRNAKQLENIIQFLEVNKSELQSVNMKDLKNGKLLEKEIEKQVEAAEIEKQVEAAKINKTIEDARKIKGMEVIDIKVDSDKDTITDVIDNKYNTIRKHLVELVRKHNMIKVKMALRAKFEKGLVDDMQEKELVIQYISDENKAVMIRNNKEIDEFLDEYHNKWEKGVNEALNKLVGSGWNFVGCSMIQISMYKMKQTHAGSYIESYDFLGRGVINIKNEDEMCFKYCIRYHELMKAGKNKNAERAVLSKDYEDKHKYDDLHFPVAIDEIETFEKHNKDLSINVWKFDITNGKRLMSCYNTSNKCDNTCNLLVIEKDDNFHYVYIKDHGNFIKQVAGTSDDKKVVCLKCGHEHDKRYNHRCSAEACKTTIKYVNEAVTFKGEHKMVWHPFVVYADFESTLYKTEDSKKVNRHEVNSYAYKLVCSFDASLTRDIKLYRGPNAIDKFIEEMKKVQKETMHEIYRRRKMYKDHNLSANELIAFNESKKCYLCDVDFCETTGKVKEHCHLSGKYRGSACNSCNMKLQDRKQHELVIFFHNLGYDGQFILANASKHIDEKTNIDIIATSSEKYMQFSIGNLVFKDSFKFMSSSLERLCEASEVESFRYTKEHFGDKFDLILESHDGKQTMSKGEYPYEWLDNTDKFKSQIFPEHKAFYSSIKCSNISLEDYEKAKRMYVASNCNEFGDYHDFYLKLDVLQLTDLFENMRALCMNNYGLDMAHYMSIPSVSWDAFLLMNKRENSNKADDKKVIMRTICDEEIKKFYDEHKLGSICQVMGQKYATANNKYMGDSFDKDKKSNYLLYIDGNNLFGWVMALKLPYEILEKVMISLQELIECDDNGDIGYTVCCDIHIPEALHDKFNGFVPCPQRKSVSYDKLSNYQKEILSNNNTSEKVRHVESDKVLLDFTDKIEYKIDFRLLKLFVRMGVEVTKIHFAYKYKMDYVIKNYIMDNTDRRKKQTSDFMKDFFKLLNNSIYGKMLQDITKQNDTKITASDDKAMKFFGFQTFKEAHYANGIYTINMEKKECVFNRPSYIGSTILDMSKYLMYDFHYNIMKPKYGDNVDLIYTDTDSFVYNVKCDDLYQDMYDMKEHFDLSEVKIDKFRCNINKKVIGKFKDETNMVPITEFIALKPKMYSFLIHGDEKKHLKVKGISKSLQKHELQHSDYTTCMQTNKDKEVKQTRIAMFERHVFTYVENKKALSNFDDKMYRLDDQNAYSFGHKNIN